MAERCRSVESMADFIVIGGGLMGLLTARELIAAGGSVCLIERSLPGRESSWAGGGILSSLHPWRMNDALWPLARWGQQAYPVLARELHDATGIDPEWQASGLLVVDEGEVDEAMDWVGDTAIGHELFDADRLASVEPGLAVGCQRALCLPDIAQIRNPRLLQALLAELSARGLAVLSGREVTAIEQQQGRVIGVSCGAERWLAGQVIVCSGAWSGQLLRSLDADVSIEPVRGQMLLYRAAPGALKHILLDRDRYLIPRLDGHILVGSTVEHTGFDKEITIAAADELQAEAGRLLPLLGEQRPVAHWAGLRPGREGTPVIGPVAGVRGLFVNAGHYRNGVLLGPASARLVADLVLGRPSIFDPSPFSPA